MPDVTPVTPLSPMGCHPGDLLDYVNALYVKIAFCHERGNQPFRMDRLDSFVACLVRSRSITWLTMTCRSAKAIRTR